MASSGLVGWGGSSGARVPCLPRRGVRAPLWNRCHSPTRAGCFGVLWNVSRPARSRVGPLVSVVGEAAVAADRAVAVFPPGEAVECVDHLLGLDHEVAAALHGVVQRRVAPSARAAEGMAHPAH